MRDYKVQELLKEVKNLSLQITTLKTEFAANTQAKGFNTTAIEAMTEGIKHLADQTNSWRKDDKEHHDKERELDKQKVKV